MFPSNPALARGPAPSASRLRWSVKRKAVGIYRELITENMSQDENIYQVVGEQSLPWLRQRSFAITIRRPGPVAIGSGVVVQLAGRTFLATVAHNFAGVNESFEPKDIHVTSLSSSEFVDLKVPEWRLLPSWAELPSENIGPWKDLAWAEVDPQEVRRAGLVGVSVGELLPEAVLREDQLYAVTGMHWHSQVRYSESSAVLDYRGEPVINSIVEFTFDCRFTNPVQTPVTDDELTFIYGRQTINRDRTQVAGRAPDGMSGGGVWEISLTGSIEKPRNIQRLVGLVRATQGERILTIPIERWLSFVVSGNSDLHERLAGAPPNPGPQTDG